VQSLFGAIPVLVGTGAAGAADASVQQGASDFWYLFWFGAGWFGFVIMLLLVLSSVACLALILESWLTIRRSVLIPQGLAGQCQDLLADGDGVGAESLCKASPSLLGILILTGLREARHSPEAAIKAMEDAAQDHHARLMRKIDNLNLLSSAAPMLGLLGTVWGMVIAFQRVAETQGRADPGQLAGGIYQALFTTVLGLCIAIPGFISFGLLRNRVDALVAEASRLAEKATQPLRRARLGKRVDGGTPRRAEG